jgi:DNA repair protein RadC
MVATRFMSSGLGIREWPARERPRERLRSVGAGALSVRELLAILVGAGGEGRTAVDVAAALAAAADGSLRRMAGLPLARLEAVPGVGEAVSARIAAALELGRRLAREGPEERSRIRSPGDVHARCSPTMRDLAHEEFRVLLLNTQHAVTRELTVTRGVLDGSVVHPREVFKEAIAESAAAVVLVHNHPSGDPSPSAEDRSVTRQLAQAGAVVGIPVLDHVVIGDGRYLSFVEAGLMDSPG